MHIAIGCDHRGLGLKMSIVALLDEAGYSCNDLGTYDTNSVDYPDIAFKVAQCVSRDEADRGILICSTGIGMCIAANKVRGIRAANCNCTFGARRSREHNDANVLCLGSDIVGEALALDIIRTFLGTGFMGDRHARRLETVRRMEEDTRR